MTHALYYPRRPWEAPGPVVVYDPLTIGVGILVNIGYGGTITAFGATALGYAVLAGAALGLNLLASALTPQAQTQAYEEQQRQLAVRQSVEPRKKYFGRVKVGGLLTFFESRAGVLFTQMTHNQGEVHAFVEYWLNDKLVETDGDGFVITAPYVTTAGNVVQLIPAMGTPDQLANPVLAANFPDEVEESHRLRSVANTVALFGEVPREDIPTVYPDGQPGLRAVIDASICRRVRQGDEAWSDNAGDVIYTYLTDSVDGADYADDLINLPSFVEYAQTADEDVPLKAGGTEKRYRIWGGYSLTEPIKTVSAKLLEAGAAELYLTPEGQIAIKGGRWMPPTVTITEDDILAATWQNGPDVMGAFNELTLTYVSAGHDFQEIECDPWVDVADQVRRGETLSDAKRYLLTPSFTATRRLGKIEWHRRNPKWIGTLKLNLVWLDLVGELNVRVVFPDLDIDETFAIEKLHDIAPDLTSAVIEVASFGPEAFAWDPETEEGEEPPIPPDTATEIDLPPPSDLSLSQGGGLLYAHWTPDARTALDYDVQFRIAPSGGWYFMSIDSDKNSARTTSTSGATMDARIRTKSPGGTFGDWSSIQSILIP